ncbi:unnamed protein product [Lymnaea stagnalis]|uniref:Cadherin-like beta-sandwich-like domain-containing protein n=1 Tax=Lymnaea stagnalis TaxID=6523 RepID=A0AAV2IHX8_LYMST
MDDCNLSKLAVTPWKLSPPFKKELTEYSVTVPSAVDKITFDLLTSDNGASFSISGSGGSRDVPLTEGVISSIKIEVTSEDGHVKVYMVNVKRLSSKEALLSSLVIQNGNLEPEFNPLQCLYYCLLPCNATSAVVVALAPDPKNVVVVCGSPPGPPIPLNPGLTNIEVEITSPDGSNKKTYAVEVARKQIPRYVKFVDPKVAAEFECPISLSPFYCPITVKDSDPRRTYSGPSISELTKTSKVDPLTGEPLHPGWKIQDIQLDQNMASQMAVIPFTFSGATAPKKFGELAGILAECNKTPPALDLSGVFSNSAITLSRKLEEHKWLKSLQQIFDETNPDQLLKSAETNLKEYYIRIPKPGQFHQQYREGESPLDMLQQAIYCLATALKFKPKDAEIHLKLAMTLEEKYYAEDMFGLKKLEKEEAPSLNLQAKESSKEEEVMAICKLKGVDPSAPVSHHLKALDSEYHHLINNGQSAKADHVMSLFVWYSKKVSQEGAAAHKAEDHHSPLGQAYQKYLDALCLDESKAVYNFHVGRMLVIMGNYEDAIKRLEAALCWNSAHEMARFYLGLAISLSKEERKKRGNEAVTFLLAGMELLLTELSKEATKADETVGKSCLIAENLVRSSNVHFLRGLIQLGTLLISSNVKDALAPSDVFHTAALLASQVLPKICRGDLYKQIEWVLVDAHTQLLELLTQQQTGKEDFIAARCQRLSALIFNSSISGNSKLLELQERTCQKLVRIQPCVSYSLFLLGSAQYALYENTPDGDSAKQLLQDAQASFRASIELEGKPSIGEAPKLVTEQKWWSEIKKKNGTEKKATAATTSTPATVPSSTKPAVRGGAAAAGRGAGTQVQGDKSKHLDFYLFFLSCIFLSCLCHSHFLACLANDLDLPSIHEFDGWINYYIGDLQGGKVQVAPTAAKEDPQTSANQQPEKDEKNDAPKIVIKNVESYQARLGLARALRAADDPNEAKKYYAEVIDMAPEIHDAYIESAEMLAKSSPLEAVDVYARFPISANPSFDDAYIFGEIVGILMKNEKFDDERLAKNMIAYGKVLGVGVLDRYTKILEQKNKNAVLRKVYAGINNKPVDDPDMQAFFKFKFWI